MCRPLISLLVATVDRKQELKRLLQSLTMQSYNLIELIIVDQNPPGFLEDSLRSFDELPMKAIQTMPTGASTARNVGLVNASGDIIGFPDDDCFYSERLTEAARDFFNKDPDAGGTLTTWLPVSPTTVKPKLQGKNTQPKAISRYTAFHRGETHTQFFRRKVITRVGEFDEELRAGLPWGSGEDTDYLLNTPRMAQPQRNHLSPDPSVVGCHHPQKTSPTARAA